MNEPIYTYDPAKARSNLRKHKVSFLEAQTVFLDPSAVTLPDLEHSDYENREITLGVSNLSRILLVVHTEVVYGEVRIISARKANSYEAERYRSG